MRKRLLSVFLACALLGGVALAESESAMSCDIVLAEYTAEGDIWACTVSDENVLNVADTGRTTWEEGLYGLESSHSFSITGLAAGDASVTFTYSQDGEDGRIWDYFTYFFTVNEDLSLTLTDTQGYPEEALADRIILWQYEDQAADMVWTYAASVDGILQLEWEGDQYFAYAGYEATEETKTNCIGGLHEWGLRAIGEGDVTITFSYISTVENSLPEAVISYDFKVEPDLYILPVAIRGDSGFIPETMRYLLDMANEQ